MSPQKKLLTTKRVCSLSSKDYLLKGTNKTLRRETASARDIGKLTLSSLRSSAKNTLMGTIVTDKTLRDQTAKTTS